MPQFRCPSTEILWLVYKKDIHVRVRIHQYQRSRFPPWRSKLKRHWQEQPISVSVRVYRAGDGGV